MSVAQNRLAACVLTAVLASAAAAQERPSAPDAAGAPRGSSQDLEPSVDTSATPTTPNDTEAHAKRAPRATAAPAAAAKPAAQAPADRGEGKPKGNAKDRIELDTTQITGNRELPKVLYIVPWKHSDLSDLGGRPANSLLDEVLTPVDRDVFKREIRYYGALQPDEPRPGRAPGAPPAADAAGEAAQAPPARDEK